MSEARDLRVLLAGSDDGPEQDAGDSVPEEPKHNGAAAAPQGGSRERTGRASRAVASRVLQVRCTPDQLAELEQRARAVDAPDVSAYVRTLVFRRHGVSIEQVTPIGPVGDRTHCISVRVNAVELAKLEANRAKVGMPELGVYVRQAALRKTPIPYVPEVNRKGWEAVIAHLADLDELARHLRQLSATKPQGGIGGIFGRSKQEEQLSAVLRELMATQEAIQDLRIDIAGTPR